MSTITRRVVVTNPSGLHTRPAVMLAQLAASFNAAVSLRLEGGGETAWINAKSTAGLMRLKARRGTALQLRAEGAEAEAAAAALAALVARDFDEVRPAEPIASPSPGALTATGFAAEVASRGVGVGPLHWLTSPQATRHAAAPMPHGRLAEAIQRARQQLARLGRQANPTARAIIDFQRELLNDESWLAELDLKVSAEIAWRQLLEREIKRYRSDDDEQLRARAADLIDLRDRVLALLLGFEYSQSAPPERAIVIAEELTPSQFLALDWSCLSGAISLRGSSSSHVAMLARAQQVPLLVQLQGEIPAAAANATAIIDGEQRTGRLLLAPAPELLALDQERVVAQRQAQAQYLRFLPFPAQRRGGEPVTLYVNVDDPARLQRFNAAHCDGIGLTRTEFLLQGETLADEEAQYDLYRQLMVWADGRPVTIRTLDAGGDKPLPGLTPFDEGNPFLGVRGVRLSLAKPTLFSVQLRALARAAVHGPLKVMLPMVTLPEELRQARQLLAEAVATLQRQGVEAASPKLGIMVEVPAAALTIAAFDADFYAIGSNDLVQYTLAAGRDCAGVNYLVNPLHPAVLALITQVARHGAQRGVEVSLCGEMAAQPHCLSALFECGVKALSVPPAALGHIKAAIAQQ